MSADIPAHRWAEKRREMLRDIRTIREALSRVEAEYERAKSDTEHMRWDRDHYRHKLKGREALLDRHGIEYQR